MKENYTAHIISHTHWDREWYLNSKYTNQWLIPFFNSLFAMFEKEEDYVFVLDGQMAMVEDYFEELDKNGFNVSEYKRKIKKYVSEKRLFIGPYYLQPDWQLLSEESLVRNMLLGNKLASELGGSMSVGWMLDNFGQISQTTQLHKEFNLEGLYVWRGVEMDPTDVQAEFLWESPDGTKLPSMYLLDSYRNVMRLAEHSEIMERRVYDELEKLKPFMTTSHILLMNGYDQEMVPDDIQPYIKNGGIDTDHMKVIQSNPEKFIQSVMSENPELKTLSGALYSGRFISVFPGVMSSRMYLKLQNDAQQKYLEKNVEPLSSLVWLLGGEYENTQIREAWKTLLKNHPHDSICGVSIDDVHTDMENRSRVVNQLSISLIEQKLKELSSLIDTSRCSSEQVKVVFNPSFNTRSEIVEFENDTLFVKDIPAMGYKVVENSDSSNRNFKFTNNSAENDFIKFNLNTNGSFNVEFKKSGKTYKNLGLIEDRADTGDEYNYSYPDIDTIYTSENIVADISIDKQSKEFVRFKVSIVMDLPESDDKKHTVRSTKLRKMPIITYITVEAFSPVVKCKTVLKNTVKDHLMRVLFPSDIKTDTAYAGSPFDITKRPIFIEDYDESSIPEDVKKVIVGAREARPNTIFLNREFVDLNNGSEGLAVLSKGLPEYQVIDSDNKIALTLFRSVGWIAKEINSRIGDAGPEIFTPDAQCLREMSFEYAVYPHSGDVESGEVCRASDLFNTSVLKFTTDRHKGQLNSESSFFTAMDSLNSIKITATKRSEDGKTLIVRGYNSSTKPTDLSFTSSFKIKSAHTTNLLEESKDMVKLQDNIINLKVAPKKIFTLSIEIDRSSLNVSDSVDLIFEREDFRENFADFEYASYVTLDEIESERLRAEKLKEKIENPMWTRTALEAQLSTILAQHRYNEKRIVELGYGLNEARVQRRVFDYIKMYKDPNKK